MYAVFDTETTGLDPVKCALASIGVVVLDNNFNPIKEYYTLINEEGKEITDEALAINGLKIEDIRNGKPVDDVLDEVSELLEGNIIVNHNSAFDCAWLNARGFSIKESIDTMDLSWKKWPKEKAKLGEVCKRFAITVENAHNSLADAKMTAEALKRFAQDVYMKEYIRPVKINFDRWKR